MVVPAPARQLSILPPWDPGGTLLCRPGVAGATPIVPRWGRNGTTTSFMVGSRTTDPGVTTMPGSSTSVVVFQSYAKAALAVISSGSIDQIVTRSLPVSP